MTKFWTWMSVYGPALIPAAVLALIILGIAAGLCDAVTGGLFLAGLSSLGEALAYSKLAGSTADPAHARPYSFVAGANWMTSVVLVVLLLSTLGIRVPMTAKMPAIDSLDGLQPRHFESTKIFTRIKAMNLH
jgi:hypothetical protein